ncbi:MAG: pyrroline-5-carboxylate reductase [Acidimicrobiales bacterium]
MPPVQVRLVVVGGGQMGGALIAGLVAAGWDAWDVGVVEPAPERKERLAAEHVGINVLESVSAARVRPEGGAVLAVKPDIAESVCAGIKSSETRRVLSVVAGLSVERLEAALGADISVVRGMPNAAVRVGAGVSAVSGGGRASSEDLNWAVGLLGTVGTVVRVPERLLHVVTALSGSGPAYLCLVAEALIEAGVSGGLSREASRQLVIGTLLGSSKLMIATGEAPEKLRDSVTSPGGTTSAGLRALEARAVRSAFLEAVMSAAERSRQLGR